jgi:hypothetical protein
MHKLFRFSCNIFIKNWKRNNVEVKNAPDGKVPFVLQLQISWSLD